MAVYIRAFLYWLKIGLRLKGLKKLIVAYLFLYLFNISIDYEKNWSWNVLILYSLSTRVSDSCCQSPLLM